MNERRHVPYQDLPKTPDGKARMGWGVFGERDEVGTVNWLTPERVAAAAEEEVRTGKCISVNLPLNEPRPGIGGGSLERGAPKHVVIAMGGGGFDDKLEDFYLQGSTQWDGLAHVSHRDLGFYSGFSRDEVGQAKPAHLGVEHWHSRIVGRGVLLDAVQYHTDRDEAFPWNKPTPVTPDMIEAICQAQRVTIRPGDILMLRTGWLKGYLDLDYEARAAIAKERIVYSPGFHASDAMLEYLWDHQIPALAADNPSLEVTPSQGTGFGHYKFIAMLGFALGEFWWLEDLAADCVADGRYTSLLVSVPLRVPGGVGSPANALAIK